MERMCAHFRHMAFSYGSVNFLCGSHTHNVSCPLDLVEDYYCFNSVAFRSLEYNSVLNQILSFDVKDAPQAFLLKPLMPFYTPPVCYPRSRSVQQGCYDTIHVLAGFFLCLLSTLSFVYVICSYCDR